MPDFDVAAYERAQRSGGFVRWYAFSSTSVDRSVAEAFARADGAIFIIIRDPQHAAAADVSKCSYYPDEQEILMLPEQAFRVLAVRRVNDLTEVELHEMNRFPVDSEL